MIDENKVMEEKDESAQENEDISEKVNDEVQEVPEESKALTSKATKIKKHLEAKKLVQEAKSIVQANESELQDCRLLLEEDLRDYEDAKRSLRLGGLDDAKALLSQLGYESASDSEEEENTVVFEAKEDVKPLLLKDVNSGRFTGFLLSLLGGMATFGGLVYLATEKLGMTLDVTKIPSNETIQTLFGWFGGQVGRRDDALTGGLLLSATVLIVMILIYLLRVWLKSEANLRFANNQMKETQKYIIYKTNCKAEMDRVDTHITDAIKVLKDYEVLLNEQNGKLKRVLHFEGQKGVISDFNAKSVEEMKDTQTLIENIGRFISTSMSEDGKLSGKSSLFLHSAKESLQKVLARFT